MVEESFFLNAQRLVDIITTDQPMSGMAYHFIQCYQLYCKIEFSSIECLYVSSNVFIFFCCIFIVSGKALWQKSNFSKQVSLPYIGDEIPVSSKVC